MIDRKIAGVESFAGDCELRREQARRMCSLIRGVQLKLTPASEPGKRATFPGSVGSNAVESYAAAGWRKFTLRHVLLSRHPVRPVFPAVRFRAAYDHEPISIRIRSRRINDDRHQKVRTLIGLNTPPDQKWREF